MTTEEYLNAGLSIGYRENFPVKRKINTYHIETECRGFPVTVKVTHCFFGFGENKEYEVEGMITNAVSISDKLPLNGFGSHSYADAAETMRKAIIEVLNQLENTFILREGSSWPVGKVILTHSNH